jgi:hypothetical protein
MWIDAVIGLLLSHVYSQANAVRTSGDKAYLCGWDSPPIAHRLVLLVDRNRELVDTQRPMEQVLNVEV